MKAYTHLTLIEREKLFYLYQQGESLRTIGKVLNRSDSTICRELKRNRTGNGKNSREYLTFKYLPCKAQIKSEKRSVKQRTRSPLKETLIWLYVRQHLRKPYSWSPEQIAGRLQLDHPKKRITKETIYRYIYSRKARRYHLWECLTLVRKKRMKSNGRRVQRGSKIPGAVSIDLRPEMVNQRLIAGHWETDNVIGKQHDQSVLSVTVERVTRYTVISKIGRSSSDKVNALRKRFQTCPLQIKHTMTMDNGSENTNHQLITTHLEFDVYFTHPYHSWEKGTVENTNGRIRRFIPKGVSIDLITPDQIKLLEIKLNSTPRKCLGYLTPYEKMSQLLT